MIFIRAVNGSRKELDMLLLLWFFCIFWPPADLQIKLYTFSSSLYTSPLFLFSLPCYLYKSFVVLPLKSGLWVLTVHVLTIAASFTFFCCFCFLFLGCVCNLADVDAGNYPFSVPALLTQSLYPSI